MADPHLPKSAECPPRPVEYPCCGVPNRHSRDFLDRAEAAWLRLRERLRRPNRIDPPRSLSKFFDRLKRRATKIRCPAFFVGIVYRMVPPPTTVSPS
ncbi:MAG: hypothetical protein RR320_02560 [Oscillospiraceae bacterium]